MNIDKFMESLTALITYKLKKFIENENVNLYGDIRSAYENESTERFELYKKQYID